MSTFPFAFRKVFIGTKASQAASGTAKGIDKGFLITAGVPSQSLINTAAPFSLGVGTFGLYDPKTWLSVTAASAAVTTGKPLVLVASALMSKDKVGPFHGGYQESNKSKEINPKYVSRFYRVDPCAPNNNVIHIGNTPYTSGLVPPGVNCCFEFDCDETYFMRLDIKGSPELRYLSRNAYWTAEAYTGCCPAGSLTPTPVDSTLVFIDWATQFSFTNVPVPNKIVGPFIDIVVYDETGAAWYAPGNPAGNTPTWDTYVSSGHTTGKCAGMKIVGALVDTQFGDCTFYPTDFFEREPVKILASMRDETGDPCSFAGICVVEQCAPRQGQGFGNQVLRDLILSERYLQNDFYTGDDLRIREVTQGYDISSAIVRANLYTHYFIQHHVPRRYNPSGLSDDDQYLLDIITTGTSATFESTMATWLTACSCSASLEVFSCGAACP